MLICSVGLWEEKEFRRYSDTGQTKRKAGESEEAFWFFKWSFSAVVVSVNIPVCNLSVRFLKSIFLCKEVVGCNIVPCSFLQCIDGDRAAPTTSHSWAGGAGVPSREQPGSR